MSRSLKKGPYVHYKLNKKVEKNIQDNKKAVKTIYPGLYNRKYGWT